MEISNLKIEVSQDMPVSADKVYKAWVDAEELKQWWRPINNTLVEVKNDLKEGGTVQYTFEHNGLVISGTYHKVKENEKLVYTWNWQLPKDQERHAEYTLTVQFLPKDDGSTLHVTQETSQSKEDILPHKEGWEKGLKDLSDYLQNK